MLALLRGSHVIRHGVQTVVREPRPPWLPRGGGFYAIDRVLRCPRTPTSDRVSHRTCSPKCRSHVSGNKFLQEAPTERRPRGCSRCLLGPPTLVRNPNVSEIQTQNTPICVSERENIRTHPEQTFHGQLEFSTKNESPKKLQQINRTGPPGSSVHNSHLHPAQARPPLERAPSRSFCASPTDAHKDAAPSPSVPT